MITIIIVYDPIIPLYRNVIKIPARRYTPQGWVGELSDLMHQ